MHSLTNLTPEDIRRIVLGVMILVMSVALHEFGHAWMADHFGDDTPRRQGRVTLNPLAHADPIGTLLLPLMGGLYGTGSFGWGKPVQWNPSRIKRKYTMTTATIFVAIAGPAMNVLLAVTFAILHCVLLAKHVVGYGTEASTLLGTVVITNFILFFFNLLPVPPLDGGHVVRSFMPYRHRPAFDNFSKYGPFIVLGFMLVPALQDVFYVPAEFCARHLYHFLFSILGT